MDAKYHMHTKEYMFWRGYAIVSHKYLPKGNPFALEIYNLLVVWDRIIYVKQSYE